MSVELHAPTAPPAPPAPAARRRGARLLLNMMVQAVAAVAIAVVIVLFVYEPVRVEGSSMQPRLADNERLFVNKFIFSFEPIERGDVVVFRYPRDPSVDFIKRVIGLPGDRIQIVDGRVYVNDRLLREPYVPPMYDDYGNFPATLVPPDDYFVLGDHRNSSNDSRSWGFLDRQYIFGRAVFAYWPLPRLGWVR